jgi:formate dehydrogenase subunit gamma
LNGHLAWDETTARGVIDTLKAQPGALLPVLHGLQETFGYIAPDAEPLIADALNISRAEVHGVVTFYADFRSTPPPAHQLKLCRAEACQAMGADRLAECAAGRLGIDMGETTADHRICLEPVYCLGLCSVAPSAMLDGRIVGRLDERKLDALLAEVER